MLIAPWWPHAEPRICGVFLVVRHVEELLGAAFDEAVQRFLHQLQVLQLCPGLLLVLLQEAGDLTASSGRREKEGLSLKSEELKKPCVHPFTHIHLNLLTDCFSMRLTLSRTLVMS